MHSLVNHDVLVQVGCLFGLTGVGESLRGEGLSNSISILQDLQSPPHRKCMANRTAITSCAFSLPSSERCQRLKYST